MDNTLICGDIHLPIDIHKLSMKKWKEQKELNENDVLINVGDFGGIWYNEGHPKYKKDKYWLDWIGSKRYTFAFLDGNHENHDLLNELPIINKWGGKVGVIKTKNKDIFYLKRGEVYTINNKTYFVMGGASSNDQGNRVEGKNWWAGETLSEADIKNAHDNLKKHNYKVDVILSHTCPRVFANELVQMASSKSIYSIGNDYMDRAMSKFEDPTPLILQEFYLKVEFNQWHFGHWHLDLIKKFYDWESKKTNIFACHYKNKPYMLDFNVKT